MTISVCILTPEGIFQDDHHVDEILVTTRSGQIGILTGHAAIVSALDIGVLISRTKNNWSTLGIIGGFILVHNNRCKIIVNEAISSQSIDRDAAINEIEECKSEMMKSVSEREKSNAKMRLKRSQVRYQVSSHGTLSWTNK